MQASNRCLDLIKRYEGFKSISYMCPAGVWTIGYGSTRYLDNTKVKANELISEPWASRLLKREVMQISENLVRCLNADEIEVNQNQFDALVSFVYNLGISNLLKSTLWQYLKHNQIVKASKEFLKWDKATVNGIKIPLKGLSLRRESERQLFLEKI